MRTPRPALALLAAAALTAAGLATTTVAAQAADPLTSIRINEVQTQDDWIELVNTGTTATDVSGLVLMDNMARTLAVPAGTSIAPGGYLAVDVNTAGLAGGFGLGTNDQARVFLPDATTLVDSYSYATQPATSFARCPDATGELRFTASATKGAANDCSTLLRINEVEPSDPAGGSDWIELTNPTPFALPASGLGLADEASTRATVPAGTTIAAGGFLAVDVTGLGATADSARLIDTDGTTVRDSHTWTAANLTTFGRCPNGTGPFVDTVAATRGAANSCADVVVPAGLRINEVESNGDPVGDFVELVNTDATPVDISGYRFRDNDTARAPYVVPQGTVVAAGGYLVLAEAQFVFGLGAADSAILQLPDATTVVDSYSWTAHAQTTYGRCPNGTGAFTTTGASTRGAANNCSAPAPLVVLNEIESQGGTPADWVELANTSATAADLSGYVVKDSANTSSYVVPAGTTVPANGLLVLEQAQLGFELDAADSVRLFSSATATTPVDSYAWTTPATTTYGRCPSATGAFATTRTPTKGAANVCPGDLEVGPWPGGATVQTVDPAGLVTSNLSGLAYEGSGSAEPGTLWAVQNGPGTLFKLQRTGTTWAPAPGDWAAGKALRYTAAGTAATENPDAEGVTLTDAGSAGGVFVATERNNASGGSRPAVLRYDVSASGTSLTATGTWDLTADLPGLGANLGLEGIAWVPDSYLVSRGLRTSGGTAYAPAAYPGHGTGLFLVGVEQTGMVHAYALDQTSGTATRVASFASGFPAVMELSWEPETQQLWVVCDDTCQGRSARFGVDAAGAFAPAGGYLERPAGMANLNNEGFATAPQSECVDGLKPVFWADDNDTDTHSLRLGTLGCTSPVVTPPVTPPTTPPTTPAPPVTAPTPAPVDTTAPRRVRVKGVSNGGFYPGRAPRLRCAASDTALVSCTVTKKRQRVGRLVLVVATAKATDAAGNTSRNSKTYLVRRP